ncbi:hypothetical protein NE865_14616 [Phthorimaea operculella]|nr:hypothetical protein NE865_14616 [Phthorimaea operculella]
MPTQSDLKIYLKALERVVDFSSMNKMDIDMNYAFGLFLINVNLKTVLRHRPMNIPLLILQPIRQLVKKNTELLDFFRKMVTRDRTKGNTQNKAIYSLFSNDTSWVERLDKYDAVFQTEKRKSSLTYLRAKFGNWELYTKRIFDWEKTAIPGPKASDYCAGMLEKCHTTVSDFRVKCVLPEECVNVLLDGTDAGYALTHRLLFIILAHYGRGCDVFSHTLDKKLTTQYCSDAFNEAQYIAFHQYGINDLLMEEIALCSLEGHVEFLKRAWLGHALKHQTAHGCFAAPNVRLRKTKSTTQNPGSRPRKTKSTSHKPGSRPWAMARSPHDQIIQGGQCDGHFTATTSGALAVAVSAFLRHIGPHTVHQAILAAADPQAPDELRLLQQVSQNKTMETFGETEKTHQCL